jgi:holo-[acyl-carrier protein] synthase
LQKVKMVTLHSGIDLVDITRLEGLKPGIRTRFVQRVFTPGEREEAGDNLSRLMGKFAVKEAVAKALGCGIGVIGWQSIEVLAQENGAPSVVLRDKAKVYEQAAGITSWSVSITHEGKYAAAVAIALGEGSSPGMAG